MSSVQHLRNVPIFSDLKDSDLNIISDKMISRAYEKGQMILLEESQGETFFIIVSGAVKVTRLSDDGREVILAILGESDFFGEMSLLDGEGRSANIVANEDAEVLIDILNNVGIVLFSVLKRYPATILFVHISYR